MEKDSFARIGAATGLAFVVLDLLSAFIYPQQPRPDSQPATTLLWVHDHRVALQAGMVVALFGAAFFLWFAGYLRTYLGQLGGDGETLAPVVFGGGIAVALISAVSAMPTALLAFMESQPAGIPDATVVRMLGDLNTVFFAASSAMTGVFVLALGLVIVRKQFVARWIGWLSLIVAAFNAVAVWVGATFSTYHGKGWNVIGWGAFLGFLVVTLLVSVSLLAHQRESTAAAPSMAVG